jgi:hypothetical protein
VKYILHLAEDTATPEEAEQLAEVIRKVAPQTVAVGDEFSTETGVYRIVRVDQRRPVDIN